MLWPDAIMQADQTLSNQAHGLTVGGWIFVSSAWAAIIATALFCYRKVLGKAEARGKAASAAD